MVQEDYEENYLDYFKTLEQRIGNGTYEKDVFPTSGPRHGKPSHKKHSARRYRVIRLRISSLIVVALVISGIVLGSVKVHGYIKNKSNTDNKSISGTTNADEKTNAVAKKIVFNETANTVAIPDANNAKSAIIIDTKTNNIVASRNANQREFPASTTKIMTLLVAVENIKDFNDTFTMTLDITDPLFRQDASVAGFSDGEVISMTDLLYGTILPSGADAAMGLAIKLSGSEENFVKLMNEKVKDLGLTDTHFTNVTGLYNDNHYTTAHDMAVILDSALQNETCKKVLSQDKPYTTASTPQHPEGITLTSTLFSCMYGTEPETATIKGGKTGFVNESGYCIASYGENNTTHNQFIVVTLGNSSKWPAIFGQIDLYKQFAQ